MIGGGTALDDAVAFGQWNAAHLLERGADLDWIAPWDDLTPLDAARRGNAGALVEWLAQRGARTRAEIG